MEETAGRLLHAPLHFDRVVKNTAVESFTLHARALAAFLYPDKSQHRDTDVAADDYVSDSNEWRRVRGDLPPALLTVIRCTAKEIAHLTTERLNYDARNREWPTAAHAAVCTAPTQLSPTPTPR